MSRLLFFTFTFTFAFVAASSYGNEVGSYSAVYDVKGMMVHDGGTQTVYFLNPFERRTDDDFKIGPGGFAQWQRQTVWTKHNKNYTVKRAANGTFEAQGTVIENPWFASFKDKSPEELLDAGTQFYEQLGYTFQGKEGRWSVWTHPQLGRVGLDGWILGFVEAPGGMSFRLREDSVKYGIDESFLELPADTTFSDMGSIEDIMANARMGQPSGDASQGGARQAPDAQAMEEAMSKFRDLFGAKPGQRSTGQPTQRTDDQDATASQSAASEMSADQAVSETQD